MSYEPTTTSAAPVLSRNGQPFTAPDWNAPLDVDAVVAQVPADTQIAGMFFLALQARAKELNVALPESRPRYVPFNFYPLRELIPMMVEGAKHFYGTRSVREGLRLMGHAVPKALVNNSTVGRVVFGSAEGVHAAAEGMAKTYGINLRPPSRAEVSQSGPNWVVVHLEDVPYFLDSHHVGVFEGVMLHAGPGGSVTIAIQSSSSAELLLTW